MRLFAVPASLLVFLSLTSVAFASAADLSITNPVISGAPYVGNTATYTVQVGNSGPEATDATVVDQLGEAEQLVSITSSQGACTDTSCALGAVAPGSTVDITIKVTYTKAIYNEHTVMVSGAGNDDPDHNNDRGGAGFQVSDPEPAAPPATPVAETGSWSRAQAHLDVDALLSPYGSGAYYFEYGKTKAYGKKTATKKVSGQDEVEVKGLIDDLAMSTTYHYRVVMVVGGKSYRGKDKSAKTLGKLMYGPLTMKMVSETASSSTYTGKVGGGLADAPGACKGTITLSIYTLQGADLMTKKTTVRGDCTYKISVPFGTAKARKYGPRGRVLAQARFSGSYAVAGVGSTSLHP